MIAALDRASDVLIVGARAAVAPTVPANRLVTWARYGLTAKVPAIRLLAEPRRTATLPATSQALETAAVDVALGLVRGIHGDPTDQCGEAFVGGGTVGVDTPAWRRPG